MYPTDPLESPWRYDGTYQARQLALLDLIRIAASSGSGGGYDFNLLNQEATQELIRLLLVSLDGKNFATETTLSEVLSAANFDSKLLQVDTVGTTTYLGYANAGTLTSGATWAIKKIVETGSDVSITWADGNNSFDNIWDNRLTLTYS